MTNVATYSDFTGDLHLDLGTGQESQLALYITQLQEEILLRLFGRNLYAYLDVPANAAKWNELTTAGTQYYDFGGYKYKYPGLKRLICCYVYFKWQSLEFSSHTSMGETISTSANGTIIINPDKQSRIWNEMVRLYYEVINYIDYKNSVEADYFPDFDNEEIETMNTFGI